MVKPAKCGYIVMYSETMKTHSLFSWRGRPLLGLGFGLVSVQSVPITIKWAFSIPAVARVYSIKLYVIRFVSYLRQIAGIPRVLYDCCSHVKMGNHWWFYGKTREMRVYCHVLRDNENPQPILLSDQPGI
jgi:hypothetical protein